MCGIAGAFWYKRPIDSSKIVDRMLRVIQHRGPDSDGRAVLPFAEVGFRRLSIIDLATGDQPLRNEDGSVECFLNGEIYNHLELRQELESKGHRFHTQSDTEILPHLFEEKREAMFRDLNGMFAICVVDHRERKVVLARDHFGVKQLYYAATPNGVLFASELKAILAAGAFEPELDQTKILSYLSLFYCPEPDTLVRGVKKLPPASLLTLQLNSSVVPRKYYDLSAAATSQERGSGSPSETLRDLFSRSVRRQLQADVPVGVSLSGGVDSSAIAGAAALSRTSERELVALTIAWPDTVPEELACSIELCEQFGISHRVIEPQVGEVDLPLLAWVSDEPIADPATYSQFVVAQAAKEHVKVLLTGAGGDELFGGYGHYILSTKKALFAAVPAVVQDYVYTQLAHRCIDSETADALRSYKSSRLAWHFLSMNNLTADDRQLLAAFLPGSLSPQQQFASLFRAHRDCGPASQQMLVDLNTYLANQILPMVDRATMAASIEARVPFLDLSLAEFAFSLSDDIKLGRMPAPKRLLKQAVMPMVPGSVLRRKKSGMPSHFVAWLRKRPELIRQVLLGRDSFLGAILPPSWMQSLLATPAAMQRNVRVLYALIILECWHRLFIREQLYDRPAVSLHDLFAVPAAVNA